MMGRIPTTNNFTKSVSKSANIKLSAPVKDNISSHKKENMVRKNSYSSQEKSLRIFKYFIFSTSIIFGFGCFGFGLVLRFNQGFNLSEFNSPTNDSSLVESPDETLDEIIDETVRSHRGLSAWHFPQR